MPLLGLDPKETQSLCQRDTLTPMFTAVLFTTAKTQKQPKCPSPGEWIKKLWYMYVVEYYSAIKKELLSFVTEWMDLKDTMLSEREVRERESLYDLTHWERDQVYGYQRRRWGWVWRNWMKGVRRDKFPAVQYVSSGAVTCNTRTIVSPAAGVFVSLWDDGCHLNLLWNHLAVYVSRTTVVHTLTLYSAACKSHLKKLKGKKNSIKRSKEVTLWSQDGGDACGKGVRKPQLGGSVRGLWEAGDTLFPDLGGGYTTVS